MRDAAAGFFDVGILVVIVARYRHLQALVAARTVRDGAAFSAGALERRMTGRAGKLDPGRGDHGCSSNRKKKYFPQPAGSCRRLKAGSLVVDVRDSALGVSV